MMKYYEVRGDWKMMIVAADSYIDALTAARKFVRPDDWQDSEERFTASELRQPSEPEVVAYYLE